MSVTSVTQPILDKPAQVCFNGSMDHEPRTPSPFANALWRISSSAAMLATAEEGLPPMNDMGDVESDPEVDSLVQDLARQIVADES